MEPVDENSVFHPTSALPQRCVDPQRRPAHSPRSANASLRRVDVASPIHLRHRMQPVDEKSVIHPTLALRIAICRPTAPTRAFATLTRCIFAGMSLHPSPRQCMEPVDENSVFHPTSALPQRCVDPQRRPAHSPRSANASLRRVDVASPIHLRHRMQPVDEKSVIHPTLALRIAMRRPTAKTTAAKLIGLSDHASCKARGRLLRCSAVGAGACCNWKSNSTSANRPCTPRACAASGSSLKWISPISPSRVA